eukprot:3275095-Prymnesium_polylepis.1
MVGGDTLRKGAVIKEFAGVRPPLGASLTWETTVADPKRGVLELVALEYPGPAEDVELSIAIGSDGGSGSKVTIGASFVPDGPLGLVIGPALGIELALSAALLFPARLKPGGSSLKPVLAWSVLIPAWAAVSYGFFAAFG